MRHRPADDLLRPGGNASMEHVHTGKRLFKMTIVNHTEPVAVHIMTSQYYTGYHDNGLWFARGSLIVSLP